MNPRRSFVPKVDFGALVKKYQQRDSAIKEPSEIKISAIEEERPPVPSAPVSQSRRSSQHDISVGEIVLDIKLPVSRKPADREKIKLLQRVFFSDGRPDIRLTNDKAQYLEICDYVYQIELERMRLYYKDHERFTEIIDVFTQQMAEFFRKEISLREDSKKTQKLNLSYKEIEIARLNAQIEELDREITIANQTRRQIENGLDDHIEEHGIFQVLRARFKDLCYSKQSTRVVTELLNHRLPEVARMSSQTLQTHQQRHRQKMSKIEEVYRKMQQQKESSSREIDAIQRRFGTEPLLECNYNQIFA